MITMLKNWNGSISINGEEFENGQALINAQKSFSGPICIRLQPKGVKRHIDENTKPEQHITEQKTEQMYAITVKKYMTEKAVPGFDFMANWNNNNPMPLRTMIGYVTKETKGMVYMKLHGDIVEKISQRCLCCGKPITNNVSKYFGMGPVCGNHNYVNPFTTEEELKAAVADYRTKLRNITWEGWIIKSAITDQVEYEEVK